MKNTIPIHCKKANGIDKYLVYWLIFCCHASHSSVNCSKLGITAHNNCIMIDALMYGESHIAMIEKLSKDHPIIITKYHNQLELIAHICHIRLSISTNGTGIWTNNLYIASIHKVNQIFFIKDLLLMILLNFFLNLLITNKI